MEKKANKKRVSCYNCKHYYITWDPNHPYGCHALAFKSQWLPSQMVFSSSGFECQLFSQKEDDDTTPQKSVKISKPSGTSNNKKPSPFKKVLVKKIKH